MLFNKLEILICCYGDYPDISIGNIEKIIDLSDEPENLIIRVGMNTCGEQTKKRLRELFDAKKIQTLLDLNENINKDPTMRILIDLCTEKYFAWFDDDSYPKKKGWDTKLKEFFTNNDPFDVAGFIHVSNRSYFAGYETFLAKRPWFKSFDKFDTAKDSNLKKNSIFPIGCFWVASSQFLISNDFPDKAMIKKCDDMLMGDLAYQVDAKMISLSNMWDYIDINKANRRGKGEDVTDGWKQEYFGKKNNLVKDKNYFNGITIMPCGSMCNRLQNIITSIVSCREQRIPLRLIWEISPHCGFADIANYFDIPSDVTYEALNTEKLMEIYTKQKSERNMFVRIPVHFTENVYLNHWGYTIRETEYIERQGLERLKKGINLNVLPIKPKYSELINNFCFINDIKNSTGVHIRSFEFLFGERTPDQMEITKNTFLKRISEIKGRVFLATDSKEIQSYFKNALPNKVFFYEELKNEFSLRNDLNDFEIGLIDYLILGKCKKVIGTKGSSFSHLAGLKSGDLEWLAAARECKEWDG